MKDEVSEFIELIIPELTTDELRQRCAELYKQNYELKTTPNESHLFDFFIWFRQNGKKYVDLSIEKMIDIYLNKSTCSDKLAEMTVKILPKFFDDFKNWEYADGKDAGKDFKKLFNLAKKRLK